MNYRTLTLSTLFCLGLWFAFLVTIWPQDDFTDTGVGCLDDRLELIEEN